MTQHINEAGLAIIRQFEGFRAMPYDDVAKHPTVGFGHKMLDSDTFAIPITEEFGEELLQKDVLEAEAEVNKYIRTLLNTNQFSALVSLIYNCGRLPLLGTIGRLLNQPVSPDYKNAAEAFLLWEHAGGKVIQGLSRRRQAEKELFLTSVPTT